jgi:UDP-N-acetylmuramoyl-tripeptide--D-alanyl-D-alanine ligase
VDLLVTVGDRARHIADGALAAGMETRSVRPCTGVEEASEVLDDLMVAGDVVLVKASRCMELERIVEGILNPHA